jgi:hypothetical protein
MILDSRRDNVFENGDMDLGFAVTWLSYVPTLDLRKRLRSYWVSYQSLEHCRIDCRQTCANPVPRLTEFWISLWANRTFRKLHIKHSVVWVWSLPPWRLSTVYNLRFVYVTFKVFVLRNWRWVEHRLFQTVFSLFGAMKLLKGKQL